MYVQSDGRRTSYNTLPALEHQSIEKYEVAYRKVGEKYKIIQDGVYWTCVYFR